MVPAFQSPSQAPVLETERLRLRGHRVEDFPHSAAMWADPVVVRHITGQPFSTEESWSRLPRYAGHWTLLGFGYWVVEEKATGRFAGEVGFADYRRSLDPPLEEMPEIGWVLAPEWHGLGYATEAVRAALDWGDGHFASSRTCCIIRPDNGPSIRVAGRCGYRESGVAMYKGQATMVFVR